MEREISMGTVGLRIDVYSRWQYCSVGADADTDSVVFVVAPAIEAGPSLFDFAEAEAPTLSFAD